MFVDPASKRTGWALFDDKELVGAGSVVSEDYVPVPGVPKSRNIRVRVETRLGHIASQYAELGAALKASGEAPTECYIECLPFRPTKEVAWSIGAIMVGLEQYVGRIIADDQALNPKRWQKRMGWNDREMKGASLDEVYAGRGVDPDSPLVEYLPAADSIDSLAAIGMGLSFVWDADFKSLKS